MLGWQKCRPSFISLMIVKRIIFIIFSILFCGIATAQSQSIINKLCDEAVSAMDRDDFIMAKENYDAAIAIVSEQPDSDKILCISQELSKYIIVNQAKTSKEEALEYAETLLTLEMRGLAYLATQGYFQTKESYIDEISIACVGLGYVLADAGLVTEAEEYFKYGVNVYPEATIYTHNYPLAYVELAGLYSHYRQDYISELNYDYEGLKVAISLSGIDSELCREIFSVLCLDYAWNFIFLLKTTESSKRFDKYDFQFVPYETLIELSDIWDNLRAEIIENYGKETYQSLLSVVQIELNGDDRIIFGTEEWDFLYKSLAAIHYGRIADYNKYSRLMLDCVQYDVALAYSEPIISSLRNNGYVNLAFDLYDELAIRMEERPDLIEKIELSAISMAYAYGLYDKSWEYMNGFAVNPYGADYCNINAYIEKLVLLALLYGVEKGDYQKEIDILCHAIEKANTDSSLVPKPLRKLLYNNLSVAYKGIGEKDKALMAINKAVDLGRSIAVDAGVNPNDRESFLWPVIEYSNLADLYIDKGNFSQAEEILEDCLSWYQLNDTNSFNLISIYDGLIYISSVTEDYENQRRWAEISYDKMLQIYLEQSFDMTKVQRTDYWRMVDKGSFEIFSQDALDNDSFTDLAYNSALIQKGFLMNYDLIISNNILSSGDENLIKAYRDFKNAESLGLPDRRYLEEKMMYLYSMHKEFIRDDIFITWKDVQSRLAESDIAIEFAKCCSDGQNVSYAAILLRQDWDRPIVIRLSSEREMNVQWEKGYKAYRDNDGLYALIWGKIEQYLKGVKKIYFSPYGVLSQMNIEILKNPGGKIMNEIYEMYRVSSTSDLCEAGIIEYNTAVLFGGLNYDLDTALMRTAAANHSDKAIPINNFFEFDTTVTRSGWSNLPWTKTEIEQIGSILEKESIQYLTFMSEDGTEEAFKALSGRSPQILHIATHGFYLNQKQAEKTKPDLLKRDMNDSHIYPLRRCGLILSGGQHAWLGEDLPDEINDGILTAEEIAGLNLSGTDLLVLSACQTGLGDIGTDGVYGLQRGFKIAGVETIIMSLWNVSDQATSLMMRTFYRNLVKGRSKRESFSAAQKEVRKKYNDDPYYWAAFIMLD